MKIHLKKGEVISTVNIKTCQKMIQANLLKYEYLNDLRNESHRQCIACLPYFIYILFEATKKNMTFSCQVSLRAHELKKSLTE